MFVSTIVENCLSGEKSPLSHGGKPLFHADLSPPTYKKSLARQKFTR
jgi:hypothetical protein